MNLKEIANRIASKQYPSSPLIGNDEQYRLQRIKYLASNIESELKLLDLCDVSNSLLPCKLSECKINDKRATMFCDFCKYNKQ